MIPIAKPLIGKEEIKAVIDVLNSGTIVQGPRVKEFEAQFAEFIGTKNAVAVNSGTAALHCSLYAAGISKGDEVITSPFTFIATANAILMQGATPVFVDIEDATFNIDASKIAEKITKKTKAILPVDIYGCPYEYEPVRRIAEENGLIVIEDACQAAGADYKGKKCGTLGDLSAFSFYATKNMATSEGGMLTTDNSDFAEIIRMFRHHGQSEKKKYEYYGLGYNYRITDICAAIGIEQLKKLKEWNEKRARNAEYLSKGLAGIKGIKLPIIKNGCNHVFHQYTIKVEEDFKLKRDELMELLHKKGIGTGVYYPKPMHLFEHLSQHRYKKGDFPTAERLSEQALSLPVHPSLTKEQLDKIINAFEEFR